MARMIRLSRFAFIAVVALGGCSSANDDSSSDGEQDTRRNVSAGPNEQSSGERDEPLAVDTSSDSSAEEGDVESDREQGDTVQTPAEASQTDLELIAAAQGWTLEEAQLYFDKTEAVGGVAVQIDAERPGVLVGSAVGPAPSDLPRVYIKGAADARVRELAEAAAFEIRVIDLQPYSRDDIDERQSQLTAELLGLGYQSFAVSTDIQREGLMEAMVERVAGAPDSVDAILAALPAPLRERISITLLDDAGIRDE